MFYSSYVIGGGGGVAEVVICFTSFIPRNRDSLLQDLSPLNLKLYSLTV